MSELTQRHQAPPPETKQRASKAHGSNNYDIGFKWNGVEYELVTDLMFWAQPYSVDKFLNQINQRYAYNSIVQVSERENFNFTQSENSQDGSIRVLLTRYK